MKKFFILLLALIIACNLYAATNKYDFVWKANPEPDMSSYKLFVWEGFDTTLVDTVLYNYFGNFDHDSLVAIYPDSLLQLVDIYKSEMDGKYIKLGIKAVDIAGNESDIAFSKAYKKTDLVKPTKVTMIEARK